MYKRNHLKHSTLFTIVTAALNNYDENTRRGTKKVNRNSQSSVIQLLKRCKRLKQIKIARIHLTLLLPATN